MEERRMSKGNYRTSTVNERWGGGGFPIHLSHGPMGIRLILILILIFYYFNVILLKSSGSPRPRPPPSPPLISNKALNNERSFIL